MEYLMATRSAAGGDLRSIFNEHRISFEPCSTSLSLGELELVSNGLTVRAGEGHLCFCGAAFCGSRLISKFVAGSAAALPTLVETHRASRFEVIGTFHCISHQTEQGSTIIFQDWLAGNPCYYYADNQLTGISNNIHMLAAWLKREGVALTRSVEPFLGEAAFECGLIGGAPYSEIEIVPVDHSLRLTGRKLAAVRDADSLSTLADVSYSDLIVSLSERISRRVEVLCDLAKSHSLVVDVTGGMDSRILVAAIHKLDAFRLWRFNRLFSFPNADGNMAELLASNYGMMRANLNVRRTDSQNVYSAFRHEVYHSMGTENKRGFSPNAVMPDVIRMHGGFGELGGKSQDTKRFFKSFLQDVTKDNMLSHYISKILKQCGYQGELHSWARTALSVRVEKIIDDGFELQEVPAVFYRLSKARSHYGMISHLRNMRSVYPDVLSDPLMTAAALKIGPRQSLLGRVNLDLIRRLGGDELAGQPLVGTRWSRDLFDSHEEWRRLSQEPIRHGEPKLFKTPAKLAPPPEMKIFPLRAATSTVRLSKPPTAADNRVSVQALQRQVVAYQARETGIREEVARHASPEAIRRFIEAPLERDDFSMLSLSKFVAQANTWLAGKELRYDYAEQDDC